jgi:hypothetical protein
MSKKDTKQPKSMNAQQSMANLFHPKVQASAPKANEGAKKAKRKGH